MTEVPNCIALVSFSVTLPAVTPITLKSVFGPLMVIEPVPTLMVVVPRTITAPDAPWAPSTLVTFVGVLAAMVRLPVRSVSPKSMAPLTAPPVGPFCVIDREPAEMCPALMPPVAPAKVPMVMETLPLPASITLLLAKVAVPLRRSAPTAFASLTLKVTLALSEITLAFTAILRPAWNVSAPAVPLAEVMMALEMVRSVLACNVTAVPALVRAVMVLGSMLLVAPVLVAKASCPEVRVALPPEITSMFCGSSSSVPATPCGALASTLPRKLSAPLLDTSTNPPAPDLSPPRASMFPAKEVSPFDQTATWPPAPLRRALASMLVVFAMTVCCASLIAVSSPCKPPPTETVPPPVAPLASIEVVSNSPTRSALTATVPPRPAALEASRRVLP